MKPLDKPKTGKIRICLVTSIFHGFGKIGGFGTMAKSLAMVLTESGYDVVVAVPLPHPIGERVQAEDRQVAYFGVVVSHQGELPDQIRPVTLPHQPATEREQQ